MSFKKVMIIVLHILGILKVILCTPLPPVDDELIERPVDTLSSTQRYGYCSAPLGIARDSLNIQVGFTVNSTDRDTEAAHLNGATAARNPNHLHGGTYIQVEFEERKMISGIITQGNPTSPSRVTHFKVWHSPDCITFTPILNGDQPLEFATNVLVNTTTTTMFDSILVARCIRVIPTARIGTETALRFELLGCEIGSCTSSIPAEVVNADEDWTTMVSFKREKIVSSIKILLTGHEGEVDLGIPAFMIAYSRTCDFGRYGGKLIRENDRVKVFTPRAGSNEIIIEGPPFPLRAQCFTIYSPEPDMLPSPDVYVSHGHLGPFRKITPGDITVTFEGCDARERHDKLESCGKNHHVGRASGRDHRRPSQSSAAHERVKRVIGGTPSVAGEWPWLVSLHFMDYHDFTNKSGLKHLCGATLIHPEWVLTAAHCFDPGLGDGLTNKDNWMVVLGEHYQANLDGTEQVLGVEKIYKHQDFVLQEGSAVLNDIALIKLSRNATLSDYVNTICIEPNYTFPDGTTCVTAGWGFTTLINGSGVALPNHAEIKLLPQATCAQRYGLLADSHEVKSYVSIEDSVICAMSEENGTDSCWGDSGGPLMCFHDNHWTQVGIVSFGYQCGDVRYPGIYTNINYFYDWMTNIIENN